MEGKRACHLPLALPSRTVTNGLFHARSTALTRHRYSVWRGGWESSPISIIRRFPVLRAAPSGPRLPSGPQLPDIDVDADSERDRTADQSVCIRAPALRFVIPRG